MPAQAAAATAPVWPKIAAAGAAAIGSIGSSLLGGSSSPRMRSNKYGGDAHRQQIASHWNETMRMAKKHGIHPLVAYGINPSSGPRAVASGGTGSGSGLGDAVQAVGKFGQDIARSIPNNYQRQMAEIALEQERAKLDILKGQANQQAVELTKMKTGPAGTAASTPPEIQLSGQADPNPRHRFITNEIPSMDKNRFGKQSGTHPGTVYEINEQGYLNKLASEKMSDAADANPLLMADNIVIDVADRVYMNHLSRTWKGRNKMREMAKKLPQKPGRHWRWSRGLGKWVSRPNDRGMKFIDSIWPNPYGPEGPTNNFDPW